MSEGVFEDLLAGNRDYAQHYELAGMPSQPRARLCLITCMDARLDPLAMLGLRVGDAKILRTPGAHVTPDAQTGVVLACQLLGADRVAVVMHTRCAMASGTDAQLLARMPATEADKAGRVLDADPDQDARLRADVQLLRADPLIGSRAQVAGFSYDVDSGLLSPVC